MTTEHGTLKAYLAIQAKELEEHKYFLSQKKGYDVGNNEAAFDWIQNNYAERFNEIYNQHSSQIENICNDTCGTQANCKGLNHCPLEKRLIHDILDDWNS